MHFFKASLMATMSVNASTQCSQFQGFLGARRHRQPFQTLRAKTREVDTKNLPDYMQHKITCVQLDKNSAKYFALASQSSQTFLSQ